MGATSAGSIQLDLEINAKLEENAKEQASKIVESIRKQLSGMKDNMFADLSKSFESALKSMTATIKQQTEASKKIMHSFIADLQKMMKNMKLASPQIPDADIADSKSKAQIIANQASPRAPPLEGTPKISLPKIKLDEQFNTEITKQRIAELKNTLNELTDNMDLLDQKRKQLLHDSLEAEILKDTKAINQLDIEVKKIDLSISKLNNKAEKTKITLSALERAMNSTSTSTTILNSHQQAVSKFIEKLRSKMVQLGNSFKQSIQPGNLFKSMLDRIHSSTNKVSKSAGSSRMSIGHLIKSFTIFSLVFPIVSRGIMALGQSLGQSLMANNQFANSLNQIKTNLMAAFMPIYQAIMPALNALMSALAQVTAYIARFISSIFGKTYQQSVQAAQGLVNAKDAMGAYGNSVAKAAKQAKEALLPMDELNILQSQDTSDIDAGGSGNAPTIVPTDIDTSQLTIFEEIAQRVMGVLSQIWQPFQESWNAEGMNTIESAKFAFFGILDLLGSIGTSMLTVWTNGSGTRILTLILQIFQYIFNLIGKISNTLANAWDKGGIGTKIMQGVADTIENVLKLIHSIGESLDYVWGVVGIPLCDTFMGIISATVDIFNTLSEAILFVWDNGGSYLFEQLLILGATLFELAGYIYTQFVAPFVQWFINTIAPAIGIVMEAIGFLLDCISNLINWLMNDGKPVLDIVILTLGGLAIAFGTIPAFIAGVITVGGYLITHWEEVCEIANTVWSSIQDIFQGFDDFLTGVFSTDWSESFGFIGDIMNGFFATLSDIWEGIKSIFSGIIDFITGVFSGNWSRAWEGVKQIFKGVADTLGGIFKGPINFIIGLINGFIGGLNKIKIPDWVPAIGGMGINISKIPYLAKGGVINKPTTAVIGEAGKEVVMPLEHNTGWIDVLASSLSSKLSVMQQPTLAFAGSASMDYQSTLPKDTTNNNDNRSIIEFLNDVLIKLEELINSVEGIDTNAYIDGDDVTDIVTKNQKQREKRVGRR